MTAAVPLLDVGELVGAYRIVGALGGGGMGMVYRAVHTLLDRPAAIKVLRPELGNHAMAIDRFLTEARATTAIRHPGIVEIYDYGHTQHGNAFIAMELLEGETLGARIAKQGRLTLLEAMTIARRIAAPLAIAHDCGVVHRDLKPDNVFLVRDHEGGAVAQVKILDFGIAKLESTAVSNRTTIGLILGTPAYMSPEQCRGSSECDHRTDLFALGCILFEMLAGQPPYGTELASGEMIAAQLHSPVPDLGRFATVPSEVLRLVTRLLAKRPDDRPRDALHVVAEIDRWSSDRGIAPTSHRSRLWLAIATAGALACSLAALGVLYGGWRAAPVSTRPPGGDASHEPPSPVIGDPVRPAAPVAETARPTPPSAPSPALSPPMDASASRSEESVPSPAVPPSPVAKPRRTPQSPSEVTSDLGRAKPGDVNTTVNDMDHN